MPSLRARWAPRRHTQVLTSGRRKWVWPRHDHIFPTYRNFSSQYDWAYTSFFVLADILYYSGPSQGIYRKLGARRTLRSAAKILPWIWVFGRNLGYSMGDLGTNHCLVFLSIRLLNPVTTIICIGTRSEGITLGLIRGFCLPLAMIPKLPY